MKPPWGRPGGGCAYARRSVRGARSVCEDRASWLQGEFLPHHAGLHLLCAPLPRGSPYRVLEAPTFRRSASPPEREPPAPLRSSRSKAEVRASWQRRHGGKASETGLPAFSRGLLTSSLW